MSQTETMSGEMTENAETALRLLSASGVSVERLPALEIVLENLAEIMQERLQNIGAGSAVFEFKEAGNGRMATLISPPSGDENEVASPELYGVIKSSLGDACILLRYDPELVAAIADYIFGGDGKESFAAQSRPASLLERAVIKIFTNEVLAVLNSVFKPVGDINFSMVDVMINLDERMTEIGDRDIISVVYSFDHTESAQLKMAIPSSILSPLRQDFARMMKVKDPEPNRHWSKRMLGEIQQSDVELRTILGSCEFTLDEISRFKPGQLIAMDSGLNSLVRVECNKEPMFWCDLGQESGNYSLRIKKFVDHEQEFFNDILSG